MSASQEARAAVGPFPRLATVGRALLALGVMTLAATFIVGVIRAALASQFYGTEKALRDAAAAGADVLATQGAFATLEAWNLPLVFVGLTLALVGIATLLAAIVGTIQRRGTTLAIGVPALRDHTLAHLHANHATEGEN